MLIDGEKANLTMAKKTKEKEAKNQIQRRSLNDFIQSLQFRIAGVYSLILFGLSFGTVAVIYFLVRASIHSDDIVRPSFSFPGTNAENDLYNANLEQIEDLANRQSLDSLANYSVYALIALFAMSLVVGWFVAGSTLKPIRQITLVMRDIYSSNDLSLRISRTGAETELKKLSDTFDDMMESLEQSFKENILTLEATVNFVKESSHEIRNPLQVIRTNLQITQSNESATLEEYKETIDIVTKAIDRMSNVVDNLTQSDYYRFTQKEHSRVELSLLVKELGDEFTRPASAKGIKLKTDAEEVEILGDRVHIKQTVANLLQNSLEAFERSRNTDERSGKDKDFVPAIFLSSTQQNGYAIITVRDNGPGIPEQYKDSIFARYNRGTEREEEGRGLGLTVVRQVVESHSGRIKLESSPWESTIFTISIPLKVEGV